MGFFSGLKGAFVSTLDALDEMHAQNQRKKLEEERERQRLLNEYRSRGIYVLAVYVDGSLWNYFYYPSEKYREESVPNIWGPFLSKSGVSWHCENIDPL